MEQDMEVVFHQSGVTILRKNFTKIINFKLFCVTLVKGIQNKRSRMGETWNLERKEKRKFELYCERTLSLLENIFSHL